MLTEPTTTGDGDNSPREDFTGHVPPGRVAGESLLPVMTSTPETVDPPSDLARLLEHTEHIAALAAATYTRLGKLETVLRLLTASAPMTKKMRANLDNGLVAAGLDPTQWQ